uniref:Ribose-phosphate pyrophosphokinase N-terminal domain-containing protein n=1 Tax=Molossus molossus TaxID=27622 RepID=A0A7J8BK17_MOLMO|nr:hypothetical protein HJG59_014873 [Molossus molossus]
MYGAFKENCRLFPPFLFSRRLGVEMGKVQVYQEPNRETRVQIQESVRGKDVFIIQTVSK